MERERRRRKKVSRAGVDYSLLVVVVFLLGFGLVMLYSSSYYSASLKFNDAAWYLKKQIVATALGIVAMIFFTFFDYRWFKKFTWIIFIGSLLSVFLVLTPLGIEANGARRWVDLKVISIQPAEIVKIAVILCMAAILSYNVKKVNGLISILMVYTLALIPAGMIFLITDNFSSALIVAAIGAIMLIVACKNNKGFIALIIILMAIAVVGLLLLGGFRATRIMVWLNPEQYSSKGGFQVLQGLYAIGSGGLFGKGLGQSVQKLGFVPEAQNDMIFTIICEELGLFGGIAVLLLFAFLIWRFMVIANNATDLYGSLVAVGVMAHIAVQVILNVAVVTNTIPNTGVTLPFISYGGTSVVFLLSEMGIVLSVARRSVKAREV
ncbi:MAG: putative peptidoglycan glycosyltransferase FtsW [Lachnospiraceae bacterium]|nr:putative peptidoglycan glycosyltransferase FtsW [Lachnospiraceae bacterium]MEE0862979.1 putative peptidoglycan glycosyltransferase FtsW [Lachnospiraceae bacterium]